MLNYSFSIKNFNIPENLYKTVGGDSAKQPSFVNNSNSKLGYVLYFNLNIPTSNLVLFNNTTFVKYSSSYRRCCHNEHLHRNYELEFAHDITHCLKM